MSKYLTMFCILALVAVFAVPSHAAVQNIKVSGDITVHAIMRDNYATTYSGALRSLILPDAFVGIPLRMPFADRDRDDFLMSITRVRIGADLTDNVSATVRLLNERDWGLETAATTDVDVDLAYITLREVLFSPLTLIIGRQELPAPPGLVYLDGEVMNTANLRASDYSARTSLDGIVGVLDYEPVQIHLMKLKHVDVFETTDTDTYIVAISSPLSPQLLAALYFYDVRFSTTGWGDMNDMDVRVVGARLYTGGFPGLESIYPDLTARAEVNYQFGDAALAATPTMVPDLEAWGIQLAADYAIEHDVRPILGVEYTYLSGEEAPSTGDFEGWYPITADRALGEILDPKTNMNVYKFSGSIVPIENITAGAVWRIYRHAEAPVAADTIVRKSEKDAGDELCLTLDYDYSEDVQFGLLGAWFWPGGSYQSDYDKTASEIVGSVRLNF